MLNLPLATYNSNFVKSMKIFLITVLVNDDLKGIGRTHIKFNCDIFHFHLNNRKIY